VIHIRHETLPAGLSALVRRRADGDIDVVVSTAVSAGRQRAAVRAGVRAIQPGRHRSGPIPVPALILLALAGTWLRAAGRMMRLRPAATIAVATTAAVAAGVIAVAPHLHGPAAGRSPAGAARAPQRGAASSAAPAPGRTTPSAPAGTRPVPSGIPVAVHAPTGTTTTPVPAASGPQPATSGPQPATSAPQPTPGASTATPTPAPSDKDGRGICLSLLGVWVCV